MFEMIEADNAWDMSQVRILYESDVPFMEKKPFRLFIDRRKEGRLEVKVFKDEKGLFASFVIALIYADIVMIDYLEVMAEYRDSGVEKQMMEDIRQILPGARMVLLLRPEDEKRRAYYEEAGYIKSDYEIKMGDVQLEVYGLPDSYDHVSFEELVRVYDNVYGPAISGVLQLA